MKASVVLIILFWPLNTQSKHIADILWHKSDPMFSNTDLARLTVQLKDKININCPNSTHSNTAHEPVFAIYRVSSKAAQLCEAFDRTQLAGICRPGQTVVVSFRAFTPLPNGLEFKANSDNYFISTSTGEEEGLWNTKGGLCAKGGPKLLVHVLPKFSGNTKHNSKYTTVSSFSNHIESPQGWAQPNDAQTADDFGQGIDWIVEYVDSPPNSGAFSISSRRAILSIFSVIISCVFLLFPSR